MFKKIIFLKSLLIISFISFAFIPPYPVEGMFPLSMIHELDLKNAGLQIPVEDVYNPDGVSLIDALVRVGGCTGSFVSPEGLIITNHHCAFGAVQKASTTEQNYLEAGFHAKTKEEEIPAQGVVCRITVGYEDVSAEVLEAANSAEDVSGRSEAINKKKKEIEKREEEKDKSLKYEVSEMFTGKSYILFKYKIINDVRLVYAPPRAIGEFGGESDNWIWPRHTGDFAFMRAYVAPDGSPAEFSEDNIPFQPKKFLKVNPDGVNEGDFIFLLGYPGRTFKNQPSFYLEYQESYLLPYVSGLYEWIINQYEEKGKTDSEFALNTSSYVKSLANVKKNYHGKLKGLNRLSLVEKKKEEDKDLQQFINSNRELKEKYGNVIEQIEDVYKEKLSAGRKELFFIQLSGRVRLYKIAELIYKYRDELDKPVDEREDKFKPENREKLFKEINEAYAAYYPDIDQKILTHILSRASQFPELNDIEAISKFSKTMMPADAVKDFVTGLYDKTGLEEKEKILKLFKEDSEALIKFEDPYLDFVKEIEEAEKSYKKKEKVWDGKLNILLADYIEAKREWKKKSFVPDANATLRLTYGYIEGYSPADASYYSPITTLKGVIEKGTDQGDYELPPKVRELYNKNDLGRWRNEKLKDVPVGILYSTDTSGGNSGSPILDAWGRLVGVNFDRAYEATINDFAWDQSYSRSIGVDIRYVLWVMDKFSGADNLIDEMMGE